MIRRKAAELWVMAQNQRKKVGVLGLLGVVLVVMVIRTLLPSPTSSASAAGASPEAEADNGAEVGGGHGDGTARGRTVRVPEPPVLTRDLFRLSEAHFPPPSQTEPTPAPAQKSEPARVETVVPPARAEEPVESRVAREAARLRLSSTMRGANPIAVIEVAGRGTVLRIGQSVEGFTLVEVTPQSAVLEKEGVRVELTRGLPEH